MGPIWDYNLAFGNADYCQGGEPDNWIYRFNDYCPNDAWQVHFWWNRLLSDPYFKNKLKMRYQELRASTLDLANINATIDYHVNQLEISGASYRNFREYKTLGTYVWPNRNISSTYEGEVQYLKSWINERVNWMDANMPNL